MRTRKETTRILDEHEEGLLVVDDYEVAEMLDYLKDELIKTHDFDVYE